MATQTFPFAAYPGVTAELDVNDATWRPSRVRCLNTSAHAVGIRVLNNGTEVFSTSAPANATTQWNISGVQLGWDSVDGGIMLGTYTIHTRWPA